MVFLFVLVETKNSTESSPPSLSLSLSLRLITVRSKSTLASSRPGQRVIHHAVRALAQDAGGVPPDPARVLRAPHARAVCVEPPHPLRDLRGLQQHRAESIDRSIHRPPPQPGRLQALAQQHKRRLARDDAGVGRDLHGSTRLAASEEEQRGSARR